MNSAYGTLNWKLGKKSEKFNLETTVNEHIVIKSVKYFNLLPRKVICKEFQKDLYSFVYREIHDKVHFSKINL